MGRVVRYAHKKQVACRSGSGGRLKRRCGWRRLGEIENNSKTNSIREGHMGFRMHPPFRLGALDPAEDQSGGLGACGRLGGEIRPSPVRPGNRTGQRVKKIPKRRVFERF